MMNYKSTYPAVVIAMVATLVAGIVIARKGANSSPTDPPESI